jgi:hypothetical protein
MRKRTIIITKSNFQAFAGSGNPVRENNVRRPINLFFTQPLWIVNRRFFLKNGTRDDIPVHTFNWEEGNFAEYRTVYRLLISNHVKPFA